MAFETSGRDGPPSVASINRELCNLLNEPRIVQEFISQSRLDHLVANVYDRMVRSSKEMLVDQRVAGLNPCFHYGREPELSSIDNQ